MSDTLRRALGGIRLDGQMVLFERVDDATYQASVAVGGTSLPVRLRTLAANPAHDPSQPNPTDQELIGVSWQVVAPHDLDPAVLTDTGAPTPTLAQALNAANSNPTGAWALTVEGSDTQPGVLCQAALPAELADGQTLSVMVESTRQIVQWSGDLLGRLCRVGPWIYQDWSLAQRASQGRRYTAGQARQRLEMGQAITVLVGDPERPTTVLQITKGGALLTTSFLDLKLRPWLRFEYTRIDELAPEQDEPAAQEDLGEAAASDAEAQPQPQAMLLTSSTMHTYYEPLAPSALSASRGAPPPHRAAQATQPSTTVSYLLQRDGTYTTSQTSFTREGKVDQQQSAHGQLSAQALHQGLLPDPEFGQWGPFLRRQR